MLSFSPAPSRHWARTNEQMAMSLLLMFSTCLCSPLVPQVLGHAMSWKQLYFERNLQDVLEQFDPATSDLDQLRRLMTFSKKFVTSLRLRQLPSHLDLQHVFDCMVK